MTSHLTIPELSLVLLSGAYDAARRDFATRHFRQDDLIRLEQTQEPSASEDANRSLFQRLLPLARKRLAADPEQVTVISLPAFDRHELRAALMLARSLNVSAVAIFLSTAGGTVPVADARGTGDPEMHAAKHASGLHPKQLIGELTREGFRSVYLLSPDEAERASVELVPLPPNRRFDHGPFDIIGDIHGCYDELSELLDRLGYQIVPSRKGEETRRHPDGRTVIFLGDLVDRGPKIPEVLRLAMNLVKSGDALAVPGNHDEKLLRTLNGYQVRVRYGLEQSLEQLGRESSRFQRQVRHFLAGLVSHYVLDDGRLVVAHAGMKQSLQGRDSRRVRDFALYGETTGETDEFGLPVRYNWAADYRGSACVVYGHTPVPAPAWLNRTINIDTGCVFGGWLTALRFPENELVSVPAKHVYSHPRRPFLPETTPRITD